MEKEEPVTLQLGHKEAGHFCGQHDERSRREKQSDKVEGSQCVEDVIREVTSVLGGEEEIIQSNGVWKSGRGQSCSDTPLQESPNTETLRDDCGFGTVRRGTGVSPDFLRTGSLTRTRSDSDSRNPVLNRPSSVNTGGGKLERTLSNGSVRSKLERTLSNDGERREHRDCAKPSTTDTNRTGGGRTYFAKLNRVRSISVSPSKKKLIRTDINDTSGVSNVTSKVFVRVPSNGGKKKNIKSESNTKSNLRSLPGFVVT